MKRILAFVIVLSVLLSVCSISAAAAPVYSVAADVKAVTPFTLNAAAVTTDTGSTLINGDSSYWSTWSFYLAGYLSYAGYSVAESVYRSFSVLSSSAASLFNIELSAGAIRTDVASILNDMGSIASAIQTVITAIQTNTTSVGNGFDNLLTFLTIPNGRVMLHSNGVVQAATSNVPMWNILRHGFSGLSYNIGDVNTSVGEVEASITSLISEFSVPVGSNVLGSLGSPTSFSLRSFSDMIRIGLVGLGSGLRLEGDGVGLGSSGAVISYSNSTKYGTLMRDGFLGLRSLISGTESDNVYSLTLWDNNNDSSSVNATGLGPMLRVALVNLGSNLGKLTFMFAADDDIQLKADSQPVLDEVTDTVFGSGSGKVKLDVSNVSDLTGMSDDVLGYFETGGQIGDINIVVNDDSTWLWFTAQTAADLDTTGSSLSLASVELEPEVDSHTEWYASFYRDVLGRDYVGG